MSTTTPSNEKAAPIVLLPVDLRDYFAGKAIQGLMSQSHAGPEECTDMGHGWGEDCANDLNRHKRAVAASLSSFAYAIADEMLKARQQ